MKRLIILGLVMLLLGCATPLTAPTPTPDEHDILKAYLEEASALLDNEKKASDVLYKEIAPAKDDEPGKFSMEERKGWQELAIRTRPILLELQSQWEALNPPPMAHGYHEQMTIVIQKQLEQWLILELAPLAWENAYEDAFMRGYDLMVEGLFLEAEAQRKFQTLWKIATEGED